MYVKLKQDGNEVLINAEHVKWIARCSKGSGRCRIRVGEDKIIIDESYEQVEALLTGAGVQVYFMKAIEQQPMTGE